MWWHLDFYELSGQFWHSLHKFGPFSWEPDPVEADPLKGSRNRRKVDILGMIVGIIGSKDQLVNEYRVMLADKLLNKSDYEIDSEIRTLELLKVGVLYVNISAIWICALLVLFWSYLPWTPESMFVVLSLSRYILERVACKDVKLCLMIWLIQREQMRISKQPLRNNL